MYATPESKHWKALLPFGIYLLMYGDIYSGDMLRTNMNLPTKLFLTLEEQILQIQICLDIKPILDQIVFFY
jgi:hypothetical protein